MPIDVVCPCGCQNCANAIFCTQCGQKLSNRKKKLHAQDHVQDVLPFNKKPTTERVGTEQIGTRELTILTGLVHSHVRQLLKSGVLHVDVAKLNQFVPRKFDFALVDRCAVPDYLSLADFSRFRRVCKDALNMHRLRSCFDIMIGYHTWQNVIQFTKVKDNHILPIVKITAGNETLNEHVAAFWFSKHPVRSLHVTMTAKRREPGCFFAAIPEHTNTLITENVIEPTIVRWLNQSKICHLDTVHTCKPHMLMSEIDSRFLKSWYCRFMMNDEPNITLGQSVNLDRLAIHVYRNPSLSLYAFDRARGWIMKTKHLILNMSAHRIYELTKDQHFPVEHLTISTENDISTLLPLLSASFPHLLTFSFVLDIPCPSEFIQKCFPTLKEIIQLDVHQLAHITNRSNHGADGFLHMTET